VREHRVHPAGEREIALAAPQRVRGEMHREQR
jgi:hypothetical protein